MESEIKEHKEYYNNGQLSKQYLYKNDKLDGEYTHYYNNGQIEERGFFTNGKPTGDYTLWYKNGSRQYHVTDDNKNNTTWRYVTRWYDNGQMFTYTYYKDRRISYVHKEWASFGVLIDHYLYINGKIYVLTYRIVPSIIKLQRSFRIQRALNKYFRSRKFVEWWYSPTVKGGLLAKQDISDTLSVI